MAAVRESVIAEAVRKDVQAMHRSIRIWRQNAGKVTSETGHRVFLGPPGIADLCGLAPVRVIGTDVFFTTIFYIETKAQKGKQRDSQKNWQAMCEKMRLPYVLARSGPQAVQGLQGEFKRYGLELV